MEKKPLHCNYCNKLTFDNDEGDCEICGFSRVTPEHLVKKPYLFYWEDAVDAWVPLTGDVLVAGEVREVKIKRTDMTEEEFNNLKEV